ncbi:MAG: MFS transporter [Myxococcota bacterium]|nr:MFS transporter [Myxococcota bacterium]
MAKYRSAPVATDKMPGGIPYIVTNEAAERFSFYGMKGILVVFMTKYMLDSNGHADTMSEADARAWYHSFTSAVYFFPIFGAILSDWVLGKYRTIIWLSLVYCFGHLALAIDETRNGLLVGLILIAIGSGGIKPCVSAHVGDQFGRSNQHLLEKVFGWFYFSINLGAAASTILTPWLLKNYGPHYAFGVPGVLMGIATLLFWMGRHKFIHIPRGGTAFIKEVFSREGLFSLGKLFVIYAFVAMFWALFDQTGSAWVLQADKMDREFLGIEWLPSQIQFVNPVMIMLFIPLFSFFIYPAIDRVFKLTPIRKIGIGFFVTVPAFLLPAWIESQIEAGEVVNIGWQLLAYAIITAAEVFVSITCLEFSYTQAPKKMKSFIMACFLISVSLGNVFVTAVNVFIQNPTPSFTPDKAGTYTLKLSGKDDALAAEDTVTITVITPQEKSRNDEKLEAARKAQGPSKTARPASVDAGRNLATTAGSTVNMFAQASDGDAKGAHSYGWRLKSKPASSTLALTTVDQRYITVTPDVNGEYTFEITYTIDGQTPTDTVKLLVTPKNLAPLVNAGADTTGVVGESVELNGAESYDMNGDKVAYAWSVMSTPAGSLVTTESLIGQGFHTSTTKISGVQYYLFFSLMMLITAVLFVPYGRAYKAKTYIQDEDDATATP